MESENTPVGFPQTPPQKKKSGILKWIVALIGVLIIVGVGGWLVLSMPGSETEEGDLSPISSSTPTPIPSPSPSPSPVAMDKSEISIEILNGTGIAGEAGLLETKLNDLDFEDITTGNSPDQDVEETTATISSEIPDSIVDELTELLNDTYTDVTINRGAVSGADIRIITGPRKGSSNTSASSSPKASPSASPE